MREFSVPTSSSVADDWSCIQTVYSNAESNPDTVAFLRKNGSNWDPVTTEEFNREVRSAAKNIVAAGIQVGERVGILASTSYEWTVTDFAIWAAGAVSVPIYDSSSADQIRWIVENSGLRLLFVDSEEFMPQVREGTEGIETLDQVLMIRGSTPATEEFSRSGQEIEDAELDRRRSAVNAESLATIIYTSGTTGRPKGCELTHRNLEAEAQCILESPFETVLRPGNSTVMFLPLAHVLARGVTYAGIVARVTIAHTSDLTTITDTFGEVKPDYILAVPRVFEKVFTKAQSQARAGGKVKYRIFTAAMETSIKYSKASETGKISPILKAQHALYDKLVYGKLRAALGGQCQFAISGGAPLGSRLAHFFGGLGITIYEGYGLTETTAAHSVNTATAAKIGTVGRPLPGNSVKIADDGEILLGGPVLARGYWKNEEATQKDFVDGWFYTGDLGSLDDDGFLTITGRKKEIIVTAGGKNIAPAGLEDALRADPLVSQAVCVGEGKPFIGVLVSIDEEALERWKNEHNKTASVPEILEDASLIRHIENAVTKANRSVSHTEAIKKFRILPKDLTEEDGELTPSMKVKRNIVHEKYADLIESMYAS